MAFLCLNIFLYIFVFKTLVINKFDPVHSSVQMSNWL